MSRNITDKTVGKIRSMGFDVYAPESGLTTYLWFTDGKNIGYLQTGDFGGFHMSTVHVPSRDIGTGFVIGDTDITIDALSRGFHVPSWAFNYNVKKYRDIDAFVASRENNIIPLVKVN